MLHAFLFNSSFELGDDPGLAKDGVEAELQALLAAQVQVLGTDWRLVRREYPTDVGPVDLLCRDTNGRAITVEGGGQGDAGQERLDRDGSLAPIRAVLVATRVKPQAHVFAESRGVECREVDLEGLQRRPAGPAPVLTGLTTR